MCEHVLTSTFAVFKCRLPVLYIFPRVITIEMATPSTDQKLDELKELFSSSMAALKHSHKETHKAMGTEMAKLKEDLAAAKDQQEEVTEHAIKLARKECLLEFNEKGHEEQFLFNRQVQDNIATASRQLGKLEQTMDGREKSQNVIDKAKEELQEGAAALTDQQKMICLANSAENGWDAVRKYKSLFKFAGNDEDNTKMVNSDWCQEEKDGVLHAWGKESQKDGPGVGQLPTTNVTCLNHNACYTKNDVAVPGSKSKGNSRTLFPVWRDGPLEGKLPKISVTVSF